MILSQEYKKKHYFFLSRKLVVCFLISITLNNTYAQVQRGKKDDAKAELISFKDRWGIKTNAVDWLLTVPNIGVEFDLGNTIRNKRTIGANIKWNWNTSQKYTPSLIFNVFDARVEWRQYFRTRKRGGVTKDANLMTRLKLPDTERFQMIKAFANCLGGYYDYRGAATVKEGEERKKVFKLVKESSPLNNIVMCMAMETDNYNKEAQKALEELPETAMTKYMKLVIYIREKKLYEWSYDNALDFDEACKKLEEIVKLDEKYYKIAVNDGEISKEFMEYYDQGDWKLY